MKKTNIDFSMIFSYLPLLTTCVLSILKLVFNVNIGWIWVLSPIWITVLIASILLVICILLNKKDDGEL